MSIAGALFTAAEPEMSVVSRMLSTLDPHRAARPRRMGAAVLGASHSGMAEDRTGQCIVLLDGAVHVGSEPRRAFGTSDAELITAAYRGRSEAFPNHVYGEYACAVWDAASQRLMLVRDHIGTHPLYFWRSAGVLLFASEPNALLSDSRVSREIDEEYMAVFLSLAPETGTRTLYRSIERVPPGHALIAERGAIRIERWWYPENLPMLRMARHEDYAAALRESLDEAIARRIPRTGPVAATLSGGLDSGSVVSLLARRLAREDRRLGAYTLVFPPDTAGVDSRECFTDESPLAAEVAGAWKNINHKVVRAEGAPMLECTDDIGQVRGMPVRNAAFSAAWQTLRLAMEADGCRTTFYGGIGNFTFSYEGTMRPAALLRAGRLIELLSLVRGMRHHGARWSGILNQALGPNLPPALHRRLRRAAGVSAPDLLEYSAINPELAKRTGVLEQVRESGIGFVSAARGDGRALRLIALNRLDRGPNLLAMRRRGTLTAATPGADRRLIELCLSIPEEQFIYGGQPRSLIRTAMAGIVPAAVLSERRRGRQGAGWQKGFRASRQAISREVELLESSPLACRCVDVPRLRRIVERWNDAEMNLPDAAGKYLYVLGRGVAAGQFLRRFEGAND